MIGVRFWILCACPIFKWAIGNSSAKMSRLVASLLLGYLQAASQSSNDLEPRVFVEYHSSSSTENANLVEHNEASVSTVTLVGPSSLAGGASTDSPVEYDPFAPLFEEVVQSEEFAETFKQEEFLATMVNDGEQSTESEVYPNPAIASEVDGDRHTVCSSIRLSNLPDLLSIAAGKYDLASDTIGKPLARMISSFRTMRFPWNLG